MNSFRIISVFLVVWSAFVFIGNSHAETQMDMESALFQGQPMQREGSGTSWLPDSTSMHGHHFKSGSWDFMLHWNVYLRYTNQDAGSDGTRGNEKFDAPNWFMIMGKHQLGDNSALMLRSMLSLDLLTEGGKGYPLLFQSGETWHDRRLIDRQHPHDLFGELSVSYGLATAIDSGLFLYFGLPGEPALGPPTYLHRPSAQNNPDAPLGHHWQDSSHVTFGVITAGYFYKQFKIDASLFNGREPDEKRYDIDEPRFDSGSIRFSMNPSENTGLQVSHAYIKEPEVLEPEVSIHRTTASLIGNYSVSRDSRLSTALVWGMNKPDHGKAQNSFLAEADYRFGKNALFTRMEFIKKSGEELGLDEGREHDLFSISAFTLGMSRTIYSSHHVSISIGALCMVSPVEHDLRRIYGELPFSVEGYLRFSPVMTKTMSDNHIEHMGH
ncbi:MAG: hypothetical protein RDU01_06600 [Thermodesulfovibrionales bacterium]|nr:hypothetical protein [Thermodesulfovibrionales bacterium]